MSFKYDLMPMTLKSIENMYDIFRAIEQGYEPERKRRKVENREDYYREINRSVEPQYHNDNYITSAPPPQFYNQMPFYVNMPPPSLQSQSHLPPLPPPPPSLQSQPYLPPLPPPPPPFSPSQPPPPPPSQEYPY